jgi:protoporphyrinogen oxidase
MLGRKSKSIEQKNVETTLIDRFLYPKYGPGQLWEEVARRVVELGGSLVMQSRVTGLAQTEGCLHRVTALDERTGETLSFEGKYVFSTMPVDELIPAMGDAVPAEVKRVACGLRYRDFITVGLLVPRLKIKNETKIPTRNELVPDNWVYVQESSVRVGRLQLFQNWSPYMISDPDKVWLGMEYFCNRGDELWSKSDTEFAQFAATELESIGIIDASEVIDSTMLRVEKSYPAYYGTYDQFSVIREFTDGIDNLFLIGRNGMHRYNNADYSMLTAMTAVDNIIAHRTDKKNIWDVNTERDYHEEK